MCKFSLFHLVNLGSGMSQMTYPLRCLPLQLDWLEWGGLVSVFPWADGPRTSVLSAVRFLGLSCSVRTSLTSRGLSV